MDFYDHFSVEAGHMSIPPFMVRANMFTCLMLDQDWTNKVQESAKFILLIVS